MDFSQGLVDDPALNNISSINTRKTILLVNDFIAHTVDFMNKFATISEQKLYQVSKKTEKLEILISLLEAKLESVPLHETGYQPTKTSTTTPQPQQIEIGPQPPAPSAQPPPPPPPPSQNDFSSGSTAPTEAADKALAAFNGETALVPAEPVPASGSDGVMIKDDPRYKKYFDMMARGVPLFAAKQKIMLDGDGLDGSLLDLDPTTLISTTALVKFDENKIEDDSD